MGAEAQAAAAQPGGQQPTKLKVGDREYSPEDVHNLITQTSSTSRKLEEAKPVFDACNQYGVTPDILVQQAGSAFSIISELMEQGIIDENGKVKAGKPPDTSGTPPTTTSGGDQTVNRNAADSVANEALTQVLDKLSSFEKRLEIIDRAQAGMIRQDVRGKLKTTFQNLDDEDVEIVLSRGLSEKGANIYELAKTRSEAKSGKESELKAALAKEWGVDLEKINQQKSLDASGGAASLFDGKKFSFLKKGEDTLSPRQAAQEFFKRNLAEE